MVDESDRLIRLVNELLMMARADAGRNLTNDSVDMSELLKETCRQMKHLDAKLVFGQKIAPNLVIRGDRDAIKQIILIGLDNAMKHSDGEIQVNAQSIGSQVEIHIKDQDEGIPADILEHVFDRFYRGEEDKTIY